MRESQPGRDGLQGLARQRRGSRNGHSGQDGSRQFGTATVCHELAGVTGKAGRNQTGCRALPWWVVSQEPVMEPLPRHWGMHV